MKKRSGEFDGLALAGWFVLTFAAAAIGGSAASSATEFYAQLRKPAWAPPPWLFGPVWTALYVCIAVAAWRVWRRRPAPGMGLALALWGVQLLLNVAWTWLFFTRRSGAAAFGEIIALDVAILATLLAFLRVDRAAALLLVPYLAWSLFATLLTYTVWSRNPLLL